MMDAHIVYLGRARGEVKVHPPAVRSGPAVERAHHGRAAALHAEWLDRHAHPIGVPAGPKTLDVAERRLGGLAEIRRNGLAVHGPAHDDGSESGLAHGLENALDRVRVDVGEVTVGG